MAANLSIQNTAYVSDQDVFLLSYPRSGNTWLRQMLTDVYFQLLGEDTSDPQFLIDHFFTASPSFENQDISNCKRPALDFFMFKCHDAQVAERFRFVYIYRNPEDALVSYFRFMKKRPITFMEEGLEDFCRLQLLAWQHHVDVAIKSSSRGLFVSYAEMITQTEACLLRVCEFVGLEATPQQISLAVSHNTPQVQRQRYTKVGGTSMADYSIATASVGGNIEFLSSALIDEIQGSAKQQIAELNRFVSVFN